MPTQRRKTPARSKTPTRRTDTKPVPKRAKPKNFLDALNAGLSPKKRIADEGAVAFGTRSIARYRLGNGLRVFLLEDHAAPVVSFHTWFAVGSRHEVEGKTGLAHLFEHLMFNETKNLPAGTFDRKLEAAGAQSNAATWNDWTYYHEDVPASQLGLVVKLEAERMKNLVLREPQVKSEKEVVANERRYRVDDDVDGAVNELLYKLAFERHPYHHPTIGWMEDILNFTTDDCRAFYRTYYAPNNATLVVVGDTTPAKLLRMLQASYGSIASSHIEEPAQVIEPEQTRERTTRIAKPTPTPKLAIGYHGPSLRDADHAPLSVLAEVLFGGRSSRLFRELVTEKEIASDLGASVSGFRDPGLFELYLTAREGTSADGLLAALDAGFDELAARPVTEDERERAIARTELGFLQGLESVGGRAEQIGFNVTVLDDPSAGWSRLEALRAVTIEQIAAVAKRYLARSRRTVIFVDPMPVEAVTEEAVAS